MQDSHLSVVVREIRGKDFVAKIWRQQMNRTYELMFIVRPDMADEDLDKLVSTLETTVTSAAGTVKAIDRMGKRRLAYMVRKFREGIYILMTIEGAGTVIHELERRLRVTEQVIKFLTVRIDEEQKRLAKIKALRDAKKKVSAQPAAAAEEAPAAVAPEAPAADVPAATV